MAYKGSPGWHPHLEGRNKNQKNLTKMKRLKFLIVAFLVLWPLLLKAQTTTSWWNIADVVSNLNDNDTLLVVTSAGTTSKLPAAVLKTYIDALQAGDNATELDGTAWRLFYVNGSGDVTELALGANGTFLESNGAAAAPGFRALASGDIPDISATYEVQLNNEAGLYAVLSDVSRFVEEDDDATLLMGTAWRVFYTDGSGDVTELALGTDGQVLTSTGASSAPAFEDPTGGGGDNDSIYHTITLVPSASETLSEGGIRYDSDDDKWKGNDGTGTEYVFNPDPVDTDTVFHKLSDWLTISGAIGRGVDADTALMVATSIIWEFPVAQDSIVFDSIFCYTRRASASASFRAYILDDEADVSKTYIHTAVTPTTGTGAGTSTFTTAGAGPGKILGVEMTAVGGTKPTRASATLFCHEKRTN